MSFDFLPSAFVSQVELAAAVFVGAIALESLHPAACAIEACRHVQRLRDALSA